MEVFSFQQSMTHCSEGFGCHSQYSFRVQPTCVDTWFLLLPWAVVRVRLTKTCPHFKIQDSRYQRYNFSLLGICGSAHQVIRIQYQEEEGMRAGAFGQPVGNPSAGGLGAYPGACELCLGSASSLNGGTTLFNLFCWHGQILDNKPYCSCASRPTHRQGIHYGWHPARQAPV